MRRALTAAAAVAALAVAGCGSGGSSYGGGGGAKGQGLTAFGGKWSTVTSSGDAAASKPAAARGGYGGGY